MKCACVFITSRLNAYSTSKPERENRKRAGTNAHAPLAFVTGLGGSESCSGGLVGSSGGGYQVRRCPSSQATVAGTGGVIYGFTVCTEFSDSDLLSGFVWENLAPGGSRPSPSLPLLFPPLLSESRPLVSRLSRREMN